MSAYLAWTPSVMSLTQSAGAMPHLNLPASSPTARASAARACDPPPPLLFALPFAHAGVMPSAATTIAAYRIFMRWLYHGPIDWVDSRESETEAPVSASGSMAMSSSLPDTEPWQPPHTELKNFCGTPREMRSPG